MSTQQHLDTLVWAATASGPVQPDEANELRESLAALVSSKDPALPAALMARHEGIAELLAGAAGGDPGAAGTVRGAIRAALMDEDVDEGEAAKSASAGAASRTAEEQANQATQEIEDDDILSIFLGTSVDSLAEIESSILELEKGNEDGADTANVLEDLKRDIHTLKGECGVLSMHDAQKVWHQIESMIEVCIDRGAAVNTDLTMDALDWQREYVARLGQDAGTSPPESSALLERIDAVIQGAPEEPIETGGNLVFSKELLEDETVPEFVTEARQHLEESEAALFELESDSTSSDGIDKVFRAFHTIKGVAGFLNITAVTDLAHVVETLLDRFRGSGLEFTSGHADVVLESKDMMERLFDALLGAEGPPFQGLASLIGRVAKVASDPASVEQKGLPPEPQAQATPNAEARETEPSTSAGTQVPEAKPEPDPVEPESRDVALKAEAPESATAAPKKASAPKKAKYDSTIRVSTQRLDSLVDMVGELVIAQQMVVQGTEDVQEVGSDHLQRNLAHLGKITRDLQEASMSLRMVTFQSTFQKMHRLVRDVASRASKSIRLEIEGADTEVDRNVVDKISDPLVHLVRNAIDHGVETPEERVAAGKPPQGTVTLAARHKGGAIIISLKDDGRGLDRNKIAAKAKEKGLMAPDRDISEMSDSAIFKLIFEPGFSTAAAVTDISGRGVGMDVVKRNIEAMRGKVEIFSTLGNGAEFQIQLPLTLAIIDAMIVGVGEQRYVIPTLAIVQSFRPSASQVHAIRGDQPMVEVRGQLVPLQRLDQILDGYRVPSDPADSTLVLVEGMGRRVCLVIDEIIGQQQVVIKKLGPCTPSARVISGGAILGDGRVALIVDIEGVLAESESVALS